MPRLAMLALALLFCASFVQAEVHTYEWIIEDWVVDFKRPTVSLKKVRQNKQGTQQEKGALGQLKIHFLLLHAAGGMSDALQTQTRLDRRPVFFFTVAYSLMRVSSS